MTPARVVRTHRRRAGGLRAIWFAIGLIGAAFSAHTAVADDIVVIRSNVPDYAEGTVLQTGATVTVPDGKEMEVMSMRGVRATITGPFSAALRVTGQKIDDTRLNAVGRAIFGLDEGTKVLGAVRWEPEQPGAETKDDKPRRAVRIDIAEGGNWCFDERTMVTFSRPRSDREDGIVFDRIESTVTAVESDDSADMKWHAFREVYAWPKDKLPLRDGWSYRIARTLLKQGTDPVPPGENPEDYMERVAFDPVTITMRRVDLSRANPDLLRQLAQADCRVQFGEAVEALTQASLIPAGHRPASKHKGLDPCGTDASDGRKVQWEWIAPVRSLFLCA